MSDTKTERVLDTLYSLANTFQMMPDYNPMLGFIEEHIKQQEQEIQELKKSNDLIKAEGLRQMLRDILHIGKNECCNDDIKWFRESISEYADNLEQKAKG